MAIRSIKREYAIGKNCFVFFFFYIGTTSPRQYQWAMVFHCLYFFNCKVFLVSLLIPIDSPVDLKWNFYLFDKKEKSYNKSLFVATQHRTAVTPAITSAMPREKIKELQCTRCLVTQYTILQCKIGILLSNKTNANCKKDGISQSAMERSTRNSEGFCTMVDDHSKVYQHFYHLHLNHTIYNFDTRRYSIHWFSGSFLSDFYIVFTVQCSCMMVFR